MIQCIGAKGVSKATEEKFLGQLLDPSDEDHEALVRYLSTLTTQNMFLLEEIASSSDLVSRDPSFVGDLLRNAFLRATNSGRRNFIRRLATKASLGASLPDSTPQELDSLTEAQRAAFIRLRAMAEIYFHGDHSPTHPVKLRLNGFIIGSSGSGKSHLCRLLGRVLGIRTHTLTVGSWTPHGAKQSPTTYETLCDLLSVDERLILFIDELDKFRSMDNAWSLGVLTELFAVLDRTIEIGTGGWTQAHARRLRDKVFIVSAGAYHDVWTNEIGRRMGFTRSATSLDDIRTKVETTNLIPAELLFRFNSEWLVIPPMTAADFQQVISRLNLPPGLIDPEEAAATGRNFRFIEDCLTRQAIERRLAQLTASESVQRAPRSTHRICPA